MIDENRFFREVTLRICGTLSIEEGLSACIKYFSLHMPADSLLLVEHERNLNALRLVAKAKADRCEKINVLVPFSQQWKVAMSEAERAWLAGTLPPVFVSNKPQEDSLTRYLLEAFDEPISSALGLPLIVEDRVVGELILLAEGDDRFADHHARLFATLKEPFFVAMSNTLEHEEVIKLKNQLADDNRYLHQELRRISGDEIVGADFGLSGVLHQVRQVAPTESPVLLMGETGVGKDVIANAIHLGSPRREGPFIPVNCGAIPESLLDSELFGHEKGAFTGAISAKRGRFERADKGTILLDEIGEMPLEAQVRLLRVIQHREVERLGGAERIPVDIRIVTATNRDLAEMVNSGRFREDLWFRINVFPITVPPLRERTTDIPALVHHFIERKCQELKLGETPQLADGAIDVLLAYDWPGNVRELENIVERAMILYQGHPLRFDDLAPHSKSRNPIAEPKKPEHSLNLDSVISQHIEKVLARTGGKIHGPGGAGELLGVNPNTLRYKMRKLGISFRKHRTK